MAGCLFLRQLLYFCLKISLAGLQKVIHCCDGTSKHKQRVEDGTDETGLVADVSYVAARFPGLQMSIASGTHFACWHLRFETLDYLLSPNVSLYFMDDTRAVFVEVPNGVNIYDVRKFPFFFIAQRVSAVRIIEIPLTEFVKLPEKIGEPKCEVSWVFHTARCGSTLMVQALNSLPNFAAISETQEYLVHLTAMDRKPGVDIHQYVNGQEFYDLLTAAVIFHLKNFQTNEHVCMKTAASLNYLLLPAIAKRFPSHKFMSMHRHGVDTAKSLWRTTGGHTAFEIVLLLYKRFPNAILRLLHPALFPFTNGLLDEVKDYYMANVDLFVMPYFWWVTNIVCFRRAMKLIGDCRVLPVCYEDLVANKTAIMMKVFDHLGIPHQYLDTALAAMEQDSQKGSSLSKEAIQNNSAWVRDEKSVSTCQVLAKHFDMPDFDQKFRFSADYSFEFM